MESEPPKKRHKSLVACLQCKKAKARCEYSDGACHRCTALSKPCSFINDPPAVPPPLISTAASISLPLLPIQLAEGRLDSVAAVPRLAIDALGALMAQRIVGKIVPFNPDEEPMILLSQVAAGEVPEPAPTVRRILWLRPIDYFAKLIAITWSHELPQISTAIEDPRWLSRPVETLVEEGLQRVAEAHDLATWTKKLSQPRDVFDLADNAQMARLRALRANLSSTSASQEGRLLDASLLVTEASFKVLDYDALPFDFAGSFYALLQDLDGPREDVQLLKLHADLISALNDCSPAGLVDASALEEALQKRRKALAKIEEVCYRVKLAQCIAPRESMPFFLGMHLYGSFYRILARSRTLRWLVETMMALRATQPELCRRLRQGDFEQIANALPLYFLDGISSMLAFAQHYPDALAGAPDTLIIAIAFVAEANVMMEMNIREWQGAASGSVASKVRLLRLLADALSPLHASPLHTRPLIAQTARLCYALAGVAEDVTLPSISLEDILGVGWDASGA